MDTLLGNYSDGEDDYVANEVGDELHNEKSHSRLLDAISALDGKRRGASTRTLYGQDVSDAAFKPSSGSGNYSGILGKLNKSGSHSVLKRQLKAFTKDSRSLPAPPAKHVQQQVQRKVLYEDAKREISKWEPAVRDIREARQLSFPFEKPTKRMVESHMRFRPVTEREKAFAAELAKTDPMDNLPRGKLLTPREEKEIAAMTLEEAKERRAELIRRRQLMYEKVTKIRWGNKIKSKRYRRAKKKEKEKQLQKELDSLAATNPQALLDKMAEVDRKRMEERGRQRHRLGGKFARQAKMFAKYDDTKRQQIQDMVAKHKELTKKQEVLSSSDGEDYDDGTTNATTLQSVQSKSNAWMKPVDPLAGLEAEAPPTVVTKEGEEEEEEEDKDGDDLKVFLGESEVSKRKTPGSEVVIPTVIEEYDFSGLGGDEEEDDADGENDGDAEDKMGDSSVNFNSQNKKKKAEDNVNKEEADNESDGDEEQSEENVDDEDNNDDDKNDISIHTESSEMTDNNDEDDFELVSIEPPRKKTKKKDAIVDSEKSAEKKKNAKWTEDGNLSFDEGKPSKKKKKVGKKSENGEGNAGDDKPSKKKKKKKTGGKIADEDEANAVSSAEQNLMSIVQGLQDSDRNPDSANNKTTLKKSYAKTKAAAKTSTGKGGNQPEPVNHNPREVLMTIAEAFDDDDVVEEFLEEKRRKVEEETEKDQDFFLPGWGGWTGPGITTPQRVKDRFIKKAKPQPRVDNLIGHCIISTKKPANRDIEKHMLTKVPHGFRDEEHMRTVLSKPIGREFTSEVAFKRNIAPKTVVTRAGHILEPMSEDVLLKKALKPHKKQTTATDIQINYGSRRKMQVKLTQAGMKRKRGKNKK